ncbi:YicC family protein [soil metagenome]
MTGFGVAKGPVGGLSVTVEIRSLNSKFLELNLRLPSAFRDKELELRAELGKQLERGKADLNVTLDNNDLAKRSSVNKEVFAAYFEELSALGNQYHLSDVNLMDVILKMPAVLNSDKSEVDDQQWIDLKAIIATAIDNFNSFRLAEGGVLENDLKTRVKNIMGAIPILESFEQSRLDSIRTRIQKAFSELKEQTAVDQNRFEAELIYYIEKLDISEEKVRLKSHCDYFLETISSPEANGKKLGFIAQELGREINTIGAKANDAIMQRTVVEMKDELEKLKEQLANVL